MKNICILIMSVFCCLTLVGCNLSNTDSDEKLNTNTISGKILFRDPIIEGGTKSQGLVILDPSTTSITPIGVYGENARFMGSASKVLVGSVNEIEIFDILTKEIVYVYQIDNPSTQGGEIAYVDENHFSIVEGDKLILVDIQNNSKTVIAEDIGNGIHSWSSDGNNVYYSTHPEGENNKICRLNIETNKKEILFNGITPRISNDGNFVAYSSDGMNRKLIVKDLQNGEEWGYDGSPVKFCFSPDSEYIAVVEYWREPWYFDGYTVKIWDYKAGKTQIVVPKYANGQCWDIDWAEL